MSVGSGAAAPVGSIDVALAHAARLLERDPGLAAEQAAEILKTFPGQPNATLVLSMARRAQGDRQSALATLTALIQAQPRWAAAHYELGVTLSELGQGEAAVAQLKTAVELNPDFPDAWRALADHLAAIGDEPGAEGARARFLKVSTRDPRLMAAAAALCENRIPEAEALLRGHLQAHPTDIAALRMLAEVAARIGRYRDAQRLLERCQIGRAHV
jgi:predicted Zn-dependent protease